MRVVVARAGRSCGHPELNVMHNRGSCQIIGSPGTVSAAAVSFAKVRWAYARMADGFI